MTVIVRFNQGSGQIKEIVVPSWADGLRVMGKVIRRLTPPERLERDPTTCAIIASYERADPRYDFPWAVYACGDFAVQIVDKERLAALPVNAPRQRY